MAPVKIPCGGDHARFASLLILLGMQKVWYSEYTLERNLTPFSIKKLYKIFHGKETFRTMPTRTSLNELITQTNKFQNNFYYYIKPSQEKIDAYFFSTKF